jgi:hypothetical protein
MMTRCPMDLKWAAFYAVNAAIVLAETLAAVWLWS